VTAKKRLHLARVAALGCVICRNMGYGATPAEIHHIRTGQGLKRASHFETIPLCHAHHRTGGYGVAFHAGKAAFEANYGSELELLQQTIEAIDENYGHP